MRPQNIRANCPTCHGAEQERDICMTCRCHVCSGIGDVLINGAYANWATGCQHCNGTGVSIPLTVLERHEAR